MTFLASIGAPYIPGWVELSPFIADLWLIGTIVAVLLTPFFVRRPNAACGLVALVGLGIALVSLLTVGTGNTSEKFRPMLVTDDVAFFWKVLLLIFVMGVVLMWFSTTASTLHEGDGPEFFALLMAATLGMSLMGSASNLLMLFMSVELASLPSYVLAGFRKTDRIGAEASLKYVLFGAATSAIMVYGLSMLYGLYGTLQLYSSTAADGSYVAGLAEVMARTGGISALLVVGIFGLIVGIGFKVSAVPFHFWCPDVFEGASIDVSTFLSVASKGAALVLLLRVMMAIAEQFGYEPNAITTSIAAVIGVIGAITATVGNTAAYVQTNIKRLLAYSSIAHAGYMLCAISLLSRTSTSTDFYPAREAAQAILLYLAVYLFMNLGAFTVAGLVHRETGSEQISDYAGLGRRSPLLAACMAVFMISLLGLPPFAGFVAKLNLLWVLFQNGGWWWGLIIAIAVNTILSAYFYFRVIRVMYLDSSTAPAFVGNPLGLGLSVVCSVALLLMFVGFSPLSNVTHRYDRLESAAATGAGPPAAQASRAAMAPRAALQP